MHDTKITDKIRKLLALANGNTTPEEAAAAIAQAQRLMDKYRIDEAAVIAAQMAESGMDVDLTVDTAVVETISGRWPGWKSMLLRELAEANGCVSYFSRVGTQTRICVVGTEAGRAATTYMYHYLAGYHGDQGEIGRVTRRHAAGKGRSWANSFRVGMVTTITQRVQADQRESVAKLKGDLDQHALVRVEGVLARQADAVQAALPPGLRSRKLSVRGDGYEHGKAAGWGVSLGGQDRRAIGA